MVWCGTIRCDAIRYTHYVWRCILAMMVGIERWLWRRGWGVVEGGREGGRGVGWDGWVGWGEGGRVVLGSFVECVGG